MSFRRVGWVALLALVAAPLATAHAGWRVGVGIGVGIGYPGYYSRPCYPYYPYYAYPVYPAPQPVYVQPAPVYLQPAPQYGSPAPVYLQPVPAAAPAPASANGVATPPPTQSR
jgi:hypothetical protein